LVPRAGLEPARGLNPC